MWSTYLSLARIVASPPSAYRRAVPSIHANGASPINMEGGEDNPGGGLEALMVFPEGTRL